MGVCRTSCPLASSGPPPFIRLPLSLCLVSHVCMRTKQKDMESSDYLDQSTEYTHGVQVQRQRSTASVYHLMSREVQLCTNILEIYNYSMKKQKWIITYTICAAVTVGNGMFKYTVNAFSGHYIQNKLQDWIQCKWWTLWFQMCEPGGTARGTQEVHSHVGEGRSGVLVLCSLNVL